MAVALSKQPQSAAPSATDRISAAARALEEANRKLVELNEQRNQCLLKDDNAGAIELGIAIANLKLSARAEEDRIALLRERAAEEERARKAKEKEALVGKIEKKLAGRDAAGKELASALAAADRAFRKLIDIGAEVQALWSWPPSDIPAILLSPAAIAHALSGELYRVGARPRVGGGQIEPHGVHAGVTFPGAKPPRHDLVNLPERIPALTAILQQATAHGSAIMRGMRPAEVEVPVSAPAPATSGGDAPVQRSDAERRKSDLHVQMAKLAEDVTPAGEAEYLRVVGELAQVEAELAAQKQVEAQQYGR
jgi:hypothetical protein